MKEDIKIGTNGGNQFEIILRALDKPEDVIRRACETVQTCGFINYFGLQRFGKGAARSHEVGKTILKGDWEKVSLEEL